MSKKYNAFIIEDSPIDLYFEDIDRYDLINPDTKVLYKCKYSLNKVSMSRDLDYAMNNLPDGYTFMFLINEEATLSTRLKVPYTKEKVVFEEYEDVPKDEIDDAIFEMEYVAKRLIRDNEFDMRMELLMLHTHDLDYGKNHVAKYHVLTNSTRQVIDKYSKSRYFKLTISMNVNAKKLFDTIYSSTSE